MHSTAGSSTASMREVYAESLGARVRKFRRTKPDSLPRTYYNSYLNWTKFYHHRQFRSESGKVQTHQTRQFTSNMLQFLFKLVVTMGNSGACMGEVQAHQTRQFTSNIRWPAHGDDAVFCFRVKTNSFHKHWDDAVFSFAFLLYCSSLLDEFQHVMSPLD
jgi:hypothetical protein